MKKYLLNIFLFAIILFLTPQVFAQNVTSSVRCSYNGTNSTYYGDPNDGFNSARCYDIGTRYSPRLGYLEFYLPTSAMTFTAGKSYTVTMNMSTNDWRNNIIIQNVRYINSNGGVVTSPLPTMTNFRFISKKQIKFDFTLPAGIVYPYLRFVLSSSTYANPDPDISSSKYMTGDSNWNLSSIDISPVSVSSGGSSSGSYDDSSVINNNNENTTDIISNNNQNTENIINNQNELLGSACTNILDITSATVIGSGASNVSYTTSSLQFTGSSTNVNGSNFIIYTLNVNPHTNYYFSLSNGYKVIIFDRNYNDLYTSTSNSFTFNSAGYYTLLLGFFAPYNDTALYSNVMVSSSSRAFCVYGTSVSKLDDTNSAINDTNNYLQDDTDPNISDSEFTDLFNTVGFTDPLGYLLQLPVQFINQLVSQSDSCQTISLGTLWGVSITMPCINIGSIIGQQVWDIIDVLFSVGLLVVIFKNLYQTFANLMTMGGEKEAREKFSMPTPMEFLSMILGGDR